MAYRELTQEFSTVKIGGIDKETGKKNPTFIEGYYLGVETRPSKFKKDGVAFYKFQTANGYEGTYGNSAGMVTAMKKAVVGRMTKLMDTGQTLDTGKGNPMRVFKAYQDDQNTIEIDAPAEAPEHVEQEAYQSIDEEEETSLDAEEQELDVVVPPSRPIAPKVAAKAPSAESQKRIQDILAARRK